MFEIFTIHFVTSQNFILDNIKGISTGQNGDMSERVCWMFGHIANVIVDIWNWMFHFTSSNSFPARKNSVADCKGISKSVLTSQNVFFYLWKYICNMSKSFSLSLYKTFYLWCGLLRWDTPRTAIFWEQTLKGRDHLLSVSAAESSSSEIWTRELRKKKKTLNRTQTPPKVNTRRKDTVVYSDALHPAATPACQRETGRWPSALSQSTDPGRLCSARRAGRLQRPGYWWNLWQTVEKTWGKEAGWMMMDGWKKNSKQGSKSCFKCLYFS